MIPETTRCPKPAWHLRRRSALRSPILKTYPMHHHLLDPWLRPLARRQTAYQPLRLRVPRRVASLLFRQSRTKSNKCGLKSEDRTISPKLVPTLYSFYPSTLHPLYYLICPALSRFVHLYTYLDNLIQSPNDHASELQESLFLSAWTFRNLKALSETQSVLTVHRADV